MNTEGSKSSPALVRWIGRMERVPAVRAIRNGLVNLIPVLIIGAFALILKEFPVSGYKDFIRQFAGGALYALFDFVYSATFGVLSVYMTYSISRSYMKVKADRDVVQGGAVFASLLSFFMLTGVYLPGFGLDNMGPHAMFIALLSALGASAAYMRLFKLLNRRRQYLFTIGADREFNRMMSVFLPVLLTSLGFALINLLVTRIFGEESFHAVVIRLLNGMFSVGKVGFAKGFFFVLLSSVLWFFGVHGSDALEDVMQNYFVPGLAENMAAVEAGLEPQAILTKQFFDCFVLMGGCGSAICLLIAILAFSRNRAHKGVGFAASFPMLFNINELMVFGLPIIFNPTMLIPFLLVPLVCYSVSYLALSLGIVPLITASVEWTTPILLGGFLATGSPAGALLQLFNVALGVAIYLPFVRLLDRESVRMQKEHYEEFVRYYRENENELQTASLIDQNNIYGDFAKGLAADLRYRLTDFLSIYYQPQYDYAGRCVGVEALLRWKHPTHGTLYPPLVIKLASDCGILPDLEEAVIERVLHDRQRVIDRFGEGVKISVNVTASTVVTPRFLQFCRSLNEKAPFAKTNTCLEVTEQTALTQGEETRSQLRELRKMGVLLAIDDFSMGQTSLHYLTDSLFDIVKIDGSLVRGLANNPTCREIITSIVELADSLSLTVIAEYVETEELKEILHGIGCDCYQGYLFSPAVPLDEPAP
ncbi:MAG: PTS sugar transporter subunit IIC/EAL domain-containing protein [Clostridia bacterium]|nr:PTS sugar transporter subunit IIC/EAL domain-containing protein [Clostridia bacterium]